MRSNTSVEKKLWEHRWMAAVFASALLAALVLALVLTPRAAEASCPIDQTCTANHFPPDVSVDNSTVTVNEGQTATNSGTYDDTADDDNDTVSISVKGAAGQPLGSVSGGGADSGSWSWQYSTTDGPSQSQTVTVTARDSTGRSSSTTFDLTVNNVAPTASDLRAPSFAKVGTTFAISLLGVSDPSSNDTQSGFTYAFDCGGGAFGSATSTNSASCSAGADPVQKTVRGRVQDKDGYISDDYTKLVIVDGARPSGTAAINNGARRTTTRKVTLNLSAIDPAPASGVASMRFSNNGKTWSAWEAYATNKAWTLSKGTGTKTVFVQYKDNVGFVSAKAKDTIVYRP